MQLIEQWANKRVCGVAAQPKTGGTGRLAMLVLSAAAVLAACGGGTSSDQVTDKPASTSDAQRFLTQATFGPTQTDVDRLNQIGYSRWIDEQMAMSLQQSHTAFVDARDAELKADDPTNTNAKARANEMVQSFYTRALTDPAQLKMRVAFALSEIFVVSTQDSTLGDNARLVASYLDMLTERSSGSYRSLLEGVALHPAMGIYLSSRGNQKEDATTGRVPDENFAREVMQLFSIGLYQLNADGSIKTSGGKAIETYNGDDIKGLAKVFTGYSWYATDSQVAAVGNSVWKCFYRSSDCTDPNAFIRPMRGYPTYHSTSAKVVNAIGLNIADSTGHPDPVGDVRQALDKLAAHPNVAPFICKQLIQRLVTSNPSPAYVARVAQVFNTSGGNLRLVVKAILLDDDARGADSLADPQFGKVREPVLRITALLRAFKHTSDSMSGALPAAAAAGSSRTRYYDIGITDDAGKSLGQTPLRSPSVFNFYRPGYVPPKSQTSTLGMVAPEMQIVSETSVAGYVNYVMNAVGSASWNGLGTWKNYDSTGDGRIDTTTSRPDVHFDFSAEKALADKPGDLVDLISKRLLQGRMSSSLRSQIVDALGTITIPSNASADAARLNRVGAAIFLTMASPEFLVQK